MNLVPQLIFQRILFTLKTNCRFLRYMHTTRSVISEKTKSWRFCVPNSWWWLSLNPEDFPPIPFVHMWDFVYMDTTGFVRVGVRIAMESSDFTLHFNLLTVAQCKRRDGWLCKDWRFDPRLSGHKLKTPKLQIKRILFTLEHIWFS